MASARGRGALPPRGHSPAGGRTRAFIRARCGPIRATGACRPSCCAATCNGQSCPARSGRHRGCIDSRQTLAYNPQRGGCEAPTGRNTMKPLNLILTVLAVLGLAAAAPIANAQDGRERVQYELDRTDRRIEQAEELLASVDNERARAELNFAISLQAQAKAVFAVPAIAYLDRTMRLTLEARGHADRAIAIVKGLPDPDRVRVQLERTREVIERARQTI